MDRPGPRGEVARNLQSTGCGASAGGCWSSTFAPELVQPPWGGVSLPNVMEYWRSNQPSGRNAERARRGCTSWPANAALTAGRSAPGDSLERTDWVPSLSEGLTKAVLGKAPGRSGPESGGRCSWAASCLLLKRAAGRRTCMASLMARARPARGGAQGGPLRSAQCSAASFPMN